MLVLLSPAKKLDFESKFKTKESTTPEFEKLTHGLVKELKKLNESQVQKLMKLSENLGKLNYNRFQEFSLKDFGHSKQAIAAFNGDTYTGLDANGLEVKELKQAQKQVRILSGLYGLLKPFDLIQPYRLEMGTKFSFDNYKNLYEYWKKPITTKLNSEVKNAKYNCIVNCASNEYFGAVAVSDLDIPVITPVFKEKKNGEFKIISFNAKRARGMMARYIVQNKIMDPKEILNFNLDNYKYNKKLSSENTPVFTR